MVGSLVSSSASGFTLKSEFPRVAFRRTVLRIASSAFTITDYENVLSMLRAISPQQAYWLLLAKVASSPPDSTIFSSMTVF